jgi:hypothetical protein
MAKRNSECFDPMSFNIENLPQVCGNDVFEKVDEYKKIEALRLRKTEAVESTIPISTSGTITNGTNGTNGSLLSSYIPQLSDPVKILCCKAHVFRDSAGQGHLKLGVCQGCSRGAISGTPTLALLPICPTQRRH